MTEIHWMEEAAARAPREVRRIEDWIKMFLNEVEAAYSKGTEDTADADDPRQQAWLAAEKHAQLALVTRATLPLIDEVHRIGGTMLWLHAEQPPLYCLLELFAAISGTPRARLYSAQLIEADWPRLARAACVLIGSEHYPREERPRRLPLLSLGHVESLAEVERWVRSKKLLPRSKEPRVLLLDGMERLEEIEGVSGDLAKTKELHGHIKDVGSKNGVKVILRSSFADEPILLNSSEACRYVDPLWESFRARVLAGTA